MSFRGADPATSIVTAAGWTGIAAWSFWAVYNVEGIRFWFAVPLGLMLALAVGGYAIESMSQEMTVRRWAISQVVFAVFGAVFLIAGIVNADIQVTRWLCFVAGSVWVAAAALCAVAAKELF